MERVEGEQNQQKKQEDKSSEQSFILKTIYDQIVNDLTDPYKIQVNKVTIYIFYNLVVIDKYNIPIDMKNYKKINQFLEMVQSCIMEEHAYPCPLPVMGNAMNIEFASKLRNVYTCPLTDKSCIIFQREVIQNTHFFTFYIKNNPFRFIITPENLETAINIISMMIPISHKLRRLIDIKEMIDLMPGGEKQASLEENFKMNMELFDS